MPPLIIYSYYYKYKDERKVIKSLVESDNVEVAQIQINDVIPEHDNYVTSKNIPANTGTTFTSVDNMSLHHAKLHLDAYMETGQEPQKEATIQALDEE